MKLSEILKTPEKYGIYSSITGGELPESNSRNIQFQYGYNTALTSCDREIDREALWKLIVSRSVYHNFDSDKDNFITVPLNDLTDLIISTMPTWLKPTERK